MVQLVYIVGLLSLLSIVQKCVLFIQRHLHEQKTQNLLEKYGKDSWVVVTGASDGLGAEYCRQFARMGFNIALVSRTESKLKNVEAELKVINPSVKTKIVIADFARNSNIAFY